MRKWRLVDSGLSSPPFTAASDEAITFARSEELVPDTLHLYRRNKPTISMGYFQNADVLNLGFCEDHGITVLRRASGGSSVYTDSNHLIYAFVSKDLLPDDMNKAYLDVCTALRRGLEVLGVKAEYKPINDLIVDDRKISGSAQMRKWGVVLQHGTIMLDVDRELMFGALNVDVEKYRQKGFGSPGDSITSLKEILGHVPPVDEVKMAVVSGFEETFDVNITQGQLTAHENDLIKRFVVEKYGNRDWTLKR